MTAVDPLAAAVAELGALPMPVGVKPFQTVPPRPEQADVPLTKLQADLRRLLAKQRVDEAAERLRRLLADPNPHGKHGTRGEISEQRHWLHDADPDSTFPAIRVNLTKHVPEEAS